MEPIEFLTFAEAILANVTNPAGYRTAISRAYYSAFHVVKDFVEEEVGARIRGGGNEHTKVQQALLNAGVAEAHIVGSLLTSLHTARKVADYDLADATPENAAQASDAILLARRIVSALDGIRSDRMIAASVKESCATSNSAIAVHRLSIRSLSLTRSRTAAPAAA